MALSFLLLLLPLYGSLLLIRHLEEKDRQMRLGKTVEALSQSSARFSRLARPETFFMEKVTRLQKAIRLTQPLKNLLGVGDESLLSLFVFNEQGKRQKIEGFPDGMIVSSEKFFALLEKLHKTPAYDLSRMEKSLADSFIGNSDAVGIIAGQPDYLIDLRPFGSPRLGGWFPTRTPAGKLLHLLVWVDLRGIDSLKYAREALHKMEKSTAPAFCFGFAMVSEKKPWGMLGALSINQQKGAFLFQDRIAASFRHGRSLFHVTNLPSGIRLISACRTPRELPVFSTMRAGVYLLAPILVLLILWQTLLGEGVVISLQKSLAFFFGMAGLAGVVALLGFADNYREARVEWLIRNTHQQSNQILGKIDSLFTSSFSSITREYQTLLKDLERSPDKIQATMEKFCPTRKDPFFFSAYYIDEAGKLVFRGSGASGPDSHPWLKGQYDKSILSVGTQILSLFNFKPSLVTESYAQQDSSLQRVLTRPAENLLKKRGLLTRFKLAGIDATSYIDLVTDRKNHALGLLWILHDTRAMETAYIRGRVAGMKKSSDYRLMAFPKAIEDGLPTFPAGAKKWQENDVGRLLGHLNQTGTIVDRPGRLAGQSVLMTGMPGQNLREYNLLLVSPFLPIQKESERLWKGFLIGAVMTILFAIMLAVILGRSLLEPIGGLSRGIQKLLDMRLDQPIVLRSGDDLELIANGINKIMSDLQEMAQAKTVQDQLLPSEPLIGNGFRCRGWSRAGSEFAGEIFDFFLLPDGRVAMMVADVSGHGITSGLLVAMAKMAVRLFFEIHPTAPGKILNELRQNFSEYLRRITHRTFFIGVFDPEKTTLTMVGTGRFFPFLMGPPNTETANEEREAVFWGRDAEKERTLQLPPSGRLLVCTDGMVDVISTKGETLGPTGLSRVLNSLRNIPLDGLGDRMFHLLDAYSGQKDRHPDQTVLTLEWSREESKERAQG